MSSINVDAVLAQIRALQSQIKAASSSVSAPGAPLANPAQSTTPASSFAKVLKQGLDQVNQLQHNAAALATKFEQGVPGVELPQVMIEMQKASVSFRAVTEVRNRFVAAYQEIMNMPI
jgi:flagellar hook-basal body complex protein FliE